MREREKNTNKVKKTKAYFPIKCRISKVIFDNWQVLKVDVRHSHFSRLEQTNDCSQYVCKIILKIERARRLKTEHLF